MGSAFVRGKETDRIGAIVTELRRAGVDAAPHADGFTVNPGVPRPTRFHTYEDHRMAMSLSLLGLRIPGIEIADTGCVSKTYPNFLRRSCRLGLKPWLTAGSVHVGGKDTKCAAVRRGSVASSGEE